MMKYYKITQRIPQYLLITSITVLLNSGCALFIPVAAVTGGSIMLDERSVGSVMDDSVILTKIKSDFTKTDFNKMFTKISVNVKEGRVMLTGSVEQQKYAQEATKIAWSVAGVKEVINEIFVTSKQINTAQDTWIANKIRSKFLFRKHFDSINYSVVVNDSVVFLFGIAQDEKELNAAIEMASSVDGVKKVVNHVLLTKDFRRSGVR